MVQLIDDILAPRDTILVKFQGRNPFLPVSMSPGLLRNIMKISSKDIMETDVRWDATGEMRNFYGKWMGKRTEDRWTATWIRIVIQGDQHAKEKTGSVTIEIKGTIRTNFKDENFVQRAFWWLYNRSFYYKQRRMYTEMAKDNMFDIRDAFQKALGIAPR